MNNLLVEAVLVGVAASVKLTNAPHQFQLNAEVKIPIELQLGNVFLSEGTDNSHSVEITTIF